MDFRDYEEQGSALALRLFSSEPYDNTSAEDLAWADSCLSPDFELSMGSLDSFKNSFAFLGFHASKQKVSMNENGELCPTADKTHSRKRRSLPSLDDLAIEQEMENKIDHDHESNVTVETLNSRFNLENVFLPTYNENQRINVTDDPELDSVFPAFVEDQLADNIFKVWEIDIPDEEDEFIGQLTKALSECSSKTEDSLPEHSSKPEDSLPEGWGVSMGSNDQLLDDLILRFDDLSLSL